MQINKKLHFTEGKQPMNLPKHLLLITCLIANMPSVISASSPACSSLSISQSSDQQSLTQQLKDELARIKNNNIYFSYEKAIELVKAGADVDSAIDEDGTTPLIFVAQHNMPGRYIQQREFFCILIRAGADRGLRDITGKTVHDYADYDFKQIIETTDIVHAIAQRAQYSGAIKIFHEEHTQKFRDYNPKLEGINPIDYRLDHLGITALMEAARWNQTEDITLLLNAGADVDTLSDLGFTALRVAAHEDQNASSMQLLIDHGAKIDVRDDLGSNALSAAGAHGNIPGFELLLASGARFDQMGSIFQRTPSANNAQIAPLIVYYLMAHKPTRKKYKADNEFQEALAAWNLEFRDVKVASLQEPLKTLMDNAHAIESNLTPEQLSRCNAVMAKRSRIMGGGNIMQLLRQREQYNTNPLLVKRRLTHRISTMPEPLENEGDIITVQDNK